MCPYFRGVAFLDWRCDRPEEGGSSCRIDILPSSVAGCWICLLLAGHFASLSKDLGVSDQTIYNWRRQDLIDRGLKAAATSTEHQTR